MGLSLFPFFYLEKGYIFVIMEKHPIIYSKPTGKVLIHRPYSNLWTKKSYKGFTNYWYLMSILQKAKKEYIYIQNT